MEREISSLENQKHTLAGILFLALTHLSNSYFHSGASTPLKGRKNVVEKKRGYDSFNLAFTLY